MRAILILGLLAGCATMPVAAPVKAVEAVMPCRGARLMPRPLGRIRTPESLAAGYNEMKGYALATEAARSECAAKVDRIIQERQ